MSLFYGTGSRQHLRNSIGLRSPLQTTAMSLASPNSNPTRERGDAKGSLFYGMESRKPSEDPSLTRRVTIVDTCLLTGNNRYPKKVAVTARGSALVLAILEQFAHCATR